jgi:hypothetical protein
MKKKSPLLSSSGFPDSLVLPGNHMQARQHSVVIEYHPGLFGRQVKGVLKIQGHLESPGQLWYTLVPSMQCQCGPGMGTFLPSSLCTWRMLYLPVVVVGSAGSTVVT